MPKTKITLRFGNCCRTTTPHCTTQQKEVQNEKKSVEYPGF